MAPKSAPFTITLSYTGKKPDDDIKMIFTNFYVAAVKDSLTDSNISDVEKKAIIDRLIHHHSQSDQET